jgi:hypothetical protein
MGPRDVQPGNTVEIEGTGLGLTIVSRTCMARMLAHYGGKELDFYDLIDGQTYLTTALIQLLIRDRVPMSEDMSFAASWRDPGGRVWLYIGDGSGEAEKAIAAGHAFEEVVVVRASDGCSWWDWKTLTNRDLYESFRRPRCRMFVQIFAQPDSVEVRRRVLPRGEAELIPGRGSDLLWAPGEPHALRKRPRDLGQGVCWRREDHRRREALRMG